MMLCVGATRTGKTTGTTIDLKSDPRPKLWLDPQDSLCRMAARMNPTGIYDRLVSTTAIPFIHLFEADGDGLLKMQRDQIRRERFKDPFYGRRLIDELERPLIGEVTNLATKLLQYQTEYAPAYWLPHMFRDSLIERCADEDVKQQAMRFLFISPTQHRNEIGPFQRLTEPVMEDASIIARCGTVDLCEVIKREQNIYVEGHGASRNAIYAGILAYLYEGIRYVEEGNGRLLIIVDEAANYGIPKRGFFTSHVLNAVKTLEKYGLEFCFITQTLHTLEPEIQAELLDNASRIVCYRIGSPETAKIMADVFGTPRLDPMKVHHTDTRIRQVHAGYDEVHGWNRRYASPFTKDFSISESNNARARYADIADHIDHYQPLGDQLKLTEQELRTLKVGERFVYEAGRVWKEQLSPLRDPLPWGLSEKRLHQFIESMEVNPWFQKATYIAPPPASPRGRKGDKQSRNG